MKPMPSSLWWMQQPVSLTWMIQWHHCFGKSTKPVFLTVNKVDTNERPFEAAEFLQLGFEHIFIAAASGSGSGEPFDAISALITEEASEETKEMLAGLPKFAIMGQPNTGKSSLLNALTGQERTIVSDIAGTTVIRFIRTINYSRRNLSSSIRLVSGGKAKCMKTWSSILLSGQSKQWMKPMYACS